MQREVINGVPYWCDKENRIYYYNAFSTAADSSKICLGTKDKLRDDWQAVLANSLREYRENNKSRSRKPQQQKTTAV